MTAPLNKHLNCRDASGRAFTGIRTKLGWVELKHNQRVLCDPPAAWATPHQSIAHGTDPVMIAREIERAEQYNTQETQ